MASAIHLMSAPSLPGRFRGISKVLNDVFDCQISIGTIRNISEETKLKAKTIKENQELSQVTPGAHDK